MMKKGMDEAAKLNLIFLTSAVMNLKQDRYNFNKALSKAFVSIKDYRVEKYAYESGGNIVNIMLTKDNVLLCLNKCDKTIAVAVDTDDISNLNHEELKVLAKRFNIICNDDSSLSQLREEINKKIEKRSNLKIHEKLDKSKNKIEPKYTTVPEAPTIQKDVIANPK